MGLGQENTSLMFSVKLADYILTKMVSLKNFSITPPSLKFVNKILGDSEAVSSVLCFNIVISLYISGFSWAYH
jgi:hypothetical protein